MAVHGYDTGKISAIVHNTNHSWLNTLLLYYCMPRHVKVNKVSSHQIKKIDKSRNNETVGLEDYINLQTSDEKGLCPLSIFSYIDNS